jgi:hypothetical protein
MKDRWTELCESAVTELDRTKFRAILRELNQLLDERGSVSGKQQTRQRISMRKLESETRRSAR